MQSGSTENCSECALGIEAASFFSSLSAVETRRKRYSVKPDPCLKAWVTPKPRS